MLTERLWNTFTVRRCLVIAPKRVAESVWAQEALKWEHTKNLRVSLVSGTSKQRASALRADADLYVLGRDNLVWLMEQTHGRLPFEMVVLDELSGFKAQGTKRWRCVRKAIQSVPYVIGLTGTPAPNSYLDLWAQMYLLDGGERLGRTMTAYRDRYFMPGARNGHIVYDWKLRMGAQAAIDRGLKDVCLSMSSADWLDLPETLYNVVPVTLDAAARKKYERFKKEGVLPLLKRQDGFEELDPNKPEELRKMTSAIRGDMAATLAGKLLQMAGGAVYDDQRNVVEIHDAKIDALRELAEENAGHSLLVFYNYEHERDRIVAAFPKARLFRGKEDVEDWNSGGIGMLLCHPASTAFGLNLQFGGHVIVWFGCTWSRELYEQANARLSRPGQTETVVINHIVAKNTLDERVMDVLKQKGATQDALLNALKGYINKEETA